MLNSGANPVNIFGVFFVSWTISLLHTIFLVALKGSSLLKERANLLLNFFIVLSSGCQFNRAFFFVPYEWVKFTRAFDPVKPFQPGLIFVGKAWYQP